MILFHCGLGNMIFTIRTGSVCATSSTVMEQSMKWIKKDPSAVKENIIPFGIIDKENAVTIFVSEGKILKVESSTGNGAP